MHTTKITAGNYVLTHVGRVYSIEKIGDAWFAADVTTTGPAERSLSDFTDYSTATKRAMVHACGMHAEAVAADARIAARAAAEAAPAPVVATDRPVGTRVTGREAVALTAEANGWTQCTRQAGTFRRPTAHGTQEIVVTFSQAGAVTTASTFGKWDAEALGGRGYVTGRDALKLATVLGWLTSRVALAPVGHDYESNRLRAIAASRREREAAEIEAARMPAEVPASMLERGHSIRVDGGLICGRFSGATPFATGATFDLAVTSVRTVGSVTSILALADGMADQWAIRIWRNEMIALTPGARQPGRAGIATQAQGVVDAQDDAARLDRGLEIAVDAGFDVELCVDAYLVAKLWTQPNTDHLEYDAEVGGEPLLDADYSIYDVPADYRAHVLGEVETVVALHPLAVRMYLAGGSANNGQVFDSAQFGHDLLLTRDGHGAGFWDRGMGVLGDYLADVARSLGSSDDLCVIDGVLSSERPY